MTSNLHYFRYIILTSYFIVLNILFFLPGSAFPKENWLDKMWFDKWVHIGLISVFAILCCWAIKVKHRFGLLMIFIILSVYGILIEIIQEQWITYRSFDIGDWVADIAGALLGLVAWMKYGIKK
jgi:VanZ family protein